MLFNYNKQIFQQIDKLLLYIMYINNIIIIYNNYYYILLYINNYYYMLNKLISRFKIVRIKFEGAKDGKIKWNLVISFRARYNGFQFETINSKDRRSVKPF